MSQLMQKFSKNVSWLNFWIAKECPEHSFHIVSTWHFSRSLIYIHNFLKGVCLSEAESHLDSSVKVLANNKFSTKYGIFQLNSKTDKQWCTENSKGGRCNAKCSDFLDDNLSDDLKCALQVHEAYGFKNWKSWEMKCKGRDTIIADNVARCEIYRKLNRFCNLWKITLSGFPRRRRRRSN